MKFVNAVNLLTFTSIATTDNIGAQVFSFLSKSSAMMLFVGQDKLKVSLVAAVNIDFNQGSTLRLKKHSSLTHVSPRLKIGDECSFVTNTSAVAHELKSQQVDLGILQVCSDAEHVCVEDEGSLIGGRCTLRTEVADVAKWENIKVDEVERELQSCTKCEGYLACAKTVQSKVACNSCNGDYACVYFYGESVVECQ